VKQLFCIVSLLVLTACGGGGGGGAGGTSSTLAPFVNWDTSLKANQNFQVSGISVETMVVSDPTTGYFLSASDAVERSVNVTGTVNAKADNLTKFAMTSSSGRTLSFTSGIVKEGGYFVAESLDQSEKLRLADPADLDWKYQSFGYWENLSQNFSLSTDGYYSAGTVTQASAIPIRGTATYIGAGIFSYSEVGKKQVLHESSITGRADFAARELRLESILSGGTPDPKLNFSGTLNYGPGASAFSGALENTGGTMSGSASGRFYGPAAQEIGGVFSLKSPSGDQRIFGAFGAAQ
jgi:hypothetical protein